MGLDFQQEMSKKLNTSNTISYKEISDIMTAFQIASGQEFAVGRTKALLDYLKKGNVLIIENFEDSNENKIAKSILDLAMIYKNIDSYIDIMNDKDFKEYFY